MDTFNVFIKLLHKIFVIPMEYVAAVGILQIIKINKSIIARSIWNRYSITEQSGANEKNQ